LADQDWGFGLILYIHLANEKWALNIVGVKDRTNIISFAIISNFFSPFLPTVLTGFFVTDWFNAP
jgi:hypothetical protein